MSESGTGNSGRPSPQRGADLKRLMGVRREIKSRTPKFRRQESWRYGRIHEPWRKPKGIDSHMRLSVKGWPKLVKVGYRGPRPVRYLHPSGLKDVLVHNLAELENLSPETDAARLASALGKKKRLEIVRRARQLSIRVLNARGLLSASKLEGEKAEEAGGEDDTGKKKKE
jgi:large subunit ribosomal protein L32e